MSEPFHNEEVMNADGIIKLLFGILLSIIGWLGVNTMKRLQHLEGDTVRKSDLRTFLEQIRDERNQQHLESRENISEVKRAVDAVHRRIDRAFVDGSDSSDMDSRR